MLKCEQKHDGYIGYNPCFEEGGAKSRKSSLPVHVYFVNKTLKSHGNCSWFTSVILKLQLQRDKIELNCQCKRALTKQEMIGIRRFRRF